MKQGQNSINYTSKIRSVVLLIIFSVLFISNKSIAQSSTVTDLKEDGYTDMSLYFYPSTLRMVNLDNNDEFNRLIQDIKKLIFFKMNEDFETKEFYELVNTLQSSDGLEEYVVVDGPKHKFYLLGQENPAETVGVALLENEYYVFDVAGSLEIKEIPKLYQYISENDSTFKDKFTNIMNIFGEFEHEFDD